MPKKCLILFSFFVLSNVLLGQDAIIVKGIVVEVTEGRKRPISNIKVVVPGESEDVTKADGSFTLYFPPDKEYISINLEGCPHPIISPYAERVNIPPNDFLEIKVCANENKRLRGKVNSLNDKVRKLERQRILNKRQLAAMHQLLLDTIIHFEARINAMEGELTEKETLLEERNIQITALEEEVANLEIQLADALEEKYLRQQEVYGKISAALNQYIDQSKNLRDQMRPVQVKSYFSSRPARDRLYESIEKYNGARREVLDHYEEHVLAVANYWEAYELADELESVYQYLLKTVHEEGVYPMEFVVNDHLKKALTRQLSSSKARKAAEAGANESIPKLNPLIDELEEKAKTVVKKLSNNL